MTVSFWKMEVARIYRNSNTVDDIYMRTGRTLYTTWDFNKEIHDGVVFDWKPSMASKNAKVFTPTDFVVELDAKPWWVKLHEQRKTIGLLSEDENQCSFESIPGFYPCGDRKSSTTRSETLPT